jgi:hypothetical protein
LTKEYYTYNNNNNNNDDESHVRDDADKSHVRDDDDASHVRDDADKSHVRDDDKLPSTFLVTESESSIFEKVVNIISCHSPNIIVVDFFFN